MTVSLQKQKHVCCNCGVETSILSSKLLCFNCAEKQRRQVLAQKRVALNRDKLAAQGREYYVKNRDKKKLRETNTE